MQTYWDDGYLYIQLLDSEQADLLKALNKKVRVNNTEVNEQLNQGYHLTVFGWWESIKRIGASYY
jgi:hypothetical protein